MKRGKKWNAAAENIDRTKAYEPSEGFEILKKVSYSKFEGSVETAIKVNYKTLQNVRGIMTLPHGTGKKIRVIVIAREDRHAEAKEAGADFVGSTDLVEKIKKENWTEFDACVATPDMMKEVGKLGPILGRKGLMPKPKAGTVTQDVGIAVKNLKAGQMEYRPDKTGVIHLVIGRVNSSIEMLNENMKSVYQTLLRDKPADARGEYIKSVFVSPTMGPSIRLDIRSLVAAKGAK